MKLNNNVNYISNKNNESKFIKHSKQFEQLEREIPKTAEFIENKRIKVIRVRKNSKAPQDKDYYKNETPLHLLKSHNGNFGLCVGYNHESGSSLAVVDIDGFKYKSMSEKLKKMLPNRAYFDSLNDEELDKICQETKNYLYDKLSDLFESPMVSESANGGYHFFIFNKTLQEERTDRDHYISKNLKFGLDCPIKELRGLHLMNSLEIFTNYGSKQIILPSSTVIREDGTTGVYKRMEAPNFAKSWDSIGTVDDLAKTVKEGLRKKGLKWELLEEPTTEAPTKQKTNYNNSFNYNNANVVELEELEEEDLEYLVKQVGQLLELTKNKNYHNTLIVSLANGLRNQGLSDKIILSIFDKALNKYHSEHYEEHMNQVRADLKSSNPKKTGFKTIISDFEELKPYVDKLGNKIKMKKEQEEKEKNNKYYDEITAQEIETRIKEKGLYNFLDDIIKNIHIGSNKDIIRKILLGFNVIRGAGSYLCETIAKSGAGKSLEDEIAFMYAMPEEHIFKKNNMTLASFTRYEQDFFNRKIIFFGDLGGRKSFEKTEDVFDVIKSLISEKGYSRDVSEKVNGKYEVTDLSLWVESVGAVYSSVNNYFSKGDEQLESRTVKFTPTETPEMEDKILNFIFESQYKESPKNKNKEKAINDLKKWQNYLRFLIPLDINVIIPFKRVFIDFAKKSDVPKRELNQQLELFESYCILSYFDCEIINNHYVASQKQFNDYFNNISLENPLKPYESNFLKMIRGENKKHELIILNDDINSSEIGLNNCFNNVLDDMNEKQPQRTLDTDIYLEIDDLNFNQEKIFIKKLLNYYGINSRSNKFTGKRVFFTVTSLRTVYRKNNNFKNIEDVSRLLTELHKKGYLEKLEFKTNNNNIYYLSKKCKDIVISFDLTEEDIIESSNILEKNGVFN